MAPSIPLSDKQRFWQQHIKQAQAHKGSLADYAKQHQLKVNTLYYWVGVFNRSTRMKKAAIKPVGFSAVRVSSPTAQYSLQLSSRVTLQLSVLPDPQWLADVYRQLDVGT